MRKLSGLGRSLLTPLACVGMAFGSVSCGTNSVQPSGGCCGCLDNSNSAGDCSQDGSSWNNSNSNDSNLNDNFGNEGGRNDNFNGNGASQLERTLDLIGEIKTYGTARGVLLEDHDQIYVSEREDGVEVFNIANPQNPVKVGSYLPQSEVIGMTKMGGRLFFAEGFDGVSMVKVVDNGNDLELLCRTNPFWGGAYNDVYSRVYDKLFAASAPHGLVIFDHHSWLEPPVFLGSCQVSYEGAGRVVATSKHAFVTAFTGHDPDKPQLQIFDTRDPADPTYVGGFFIDGNPVDLAIKDGFLEDFVCVSSDKGGVYVVDVSNVRSPRGLAKILEGSIVTGINFGGDKAYFAALDEGIKVFDFADFSNPRLVAECDTPGRAYDVAPEFYFPRVYVADGDALRVFEMGWN